MNNDDLQQNSCRICQKMFCCKNCRKKHEFKSHNLFSECDICLNGKILLRDPSNALLEHLQSKHLPLHCIHCDIVFNTIDELYFHNKCPRSRNNENTPPVSQNIITDDGMKIVTEKCCIPTSTPVIVARKDENRFLQKMCEVITPVDIYLDKKDSVFTPIDQRDEQYIKRRVTFSKTIEEINDKDNIPVEKRLISDQPSTPDSQESLYITAANEMKTPTTILFNVHETDEKAQNELNECAVLQYSTEQNDSVWKSAVSDVFENDVEVPTSKETITVTKENLEDPYEKCWPIETVLSNHVPGIWTSMTNMFKNVIQGISVSQDATSQNDVSLKRKRSFLDNEDVDCTEKRILKRIKYTDIMIKCRPPIRYMKPAFYSRKRVQIKVVHKATQTD